MKVVAPYRALAPSSAPSSLLLASVKGSFFFTMYIDIKQLSLRSWNTVVFFCAENGYWTRRNVQGWIDSALNKGFYRYYCVLHCKCALCKVSRSKVWQWPCCIINDLRFGFLLMNRSWRPFTLKYSGGIFHFTVQFTDVNTLLLWTAKHKNVPSKNWKFPKFWEWEKMDFQHFRFYLSFLAII